MASREVVGLIIGKATTLKKSDLILLPDLQKSTSHCRRAKFFSSSIVTFGITKDP